MNSQFSYELDERQIRILMQSGELSFNETAWQRFESSEKTVSSATSKVVKFVPNINLNFSVNRSVIIPVFFVALIGGMSILLFSFVDFKKKPEVVTEKPLIITPPTTTKTTVNVSKPKPTPVKTNVSTVPNQTASQPVVSTQQAAIDLKTLENKAIEAKKESEAAKIDNNKPTEPVADTKKEDKTTVSSSTDTHKKTIDRPKKKRKKRMTAEELPTINTSPAILSTQESEPELDLK